MYEHQIDTGVNGEKRVRVGLEHEGYKSRMAILRLKGGQTMPWNVRLEAAPQVNLPPEGMVLIPAGEFSNGEQ